MRVPLFHNRKDPDSGFSLHELVGIAVALTVLKVPLRLLNNWLRPDLELRYGFEWPIWPIEAASEMLCIVFLGWLAGIVVREPYRQLVQTMALLAAVGLFRVMLTDLLVFLLRV